MTAPRAELLAIGSELLGPTRLDTNGSFLALRLGERGIAVRFRTTVGDDPDDLREAFRVALGRADLVIATGGLGPTVDDLTREALAGLLGLPLIEDPELVRGLEERFRRYGYTMAPQNRRQAFVPRGAEVIPNRLGSAPGLALRHEGRLVILLPGVPSEMRQMVEDALPGLLGPVGGRLAHRVLKIAGLSESEVDRRLTEVQRSAAPVEWTILAAPGQIEIHLRESVATGGEAEGIRRIDAAIENALGVHLFGRDEETLEGTVIALLRRRGETLATAESITGGSLARRLTGVPGASLCFRGGAVCYTDDAKAVLAQVSRETLRDHGAVSAEAALEMAAGIRSHLSSEWGLATTGIAGPEGGGPDLPPGTLHLGLAGPAARTTRELRLPGDRRLVQERATQAALDLIRRALLGLPE